MNIIQNQCQLIRHGKGDHDIWYNPITNRHITVDTKIKSRYTANAILKQNMENEYINPYT